MGAETGSVLVQSRLATLAGLYLSACSLGFFLLIADGWLAGSLAPHTQVKEFVISNWPAAAGAVEGGLTTARLRLICMGRILDSDDTSLAALNVKKFDHPTPVNVAVRPAAVAAAAARKLLQPQQHQVQPDGSGQRSSLPTDGPPRRNCCVVS